MMYWHYASTIWWWTFCEMSDAICLGVMIWSRNTSFYTEERAGNQHILYLVCPKCCFYSLTFNWGYGNPFVSSTAKATCLQFKVKCSCLSSLVDSVQESYVVGIFLKPQFEMKKKKSKNFQGHKMRMNS